MLITCIIGIRYSLRIIIGTAKYTLACRIGTSLYNVHLTLSLIDSIRHSFTNELTNIINSHAYIKLHRIYHIKSNTCSTAHISLLGIPIARLKSTNLHFYGVATFDNIDTQSNVGCHLI